MIIQKAFRDLDPTSAALRLTKEVETDGYRVNWVYATVQYTIFPGQEDAYVEMQVEKR
jgi:hypothetical protein